MAGKNRQMKLFDQRWLRALSVLAWLGSALFFGDHLPLIGGYLAAAGFALLVTSLGFERRYQRVLGTPPEGFEPTGEQFPNPPHGNTVAVYHRGVRRVYVEIRPDS